MNSIKITLNDGSEIVLSKKEKNNDINRQSIDLKRKKELDYLLSKSKSYVPNLAFPLEDVKDQEKIDVIDTTLNIESILIDFKTKKFKEAFSSLPVTLQNDPDFILKAVNSSYDTLNILINTNDLIRDSKEVVIAVVKKNGLELEYVSDRLKDDIDVVRSATKNNSNAIYFASLRIRNNKMLLKDNKEVIKIVSEIEEQLNKEEPKKKRFSLFKKRS